MVVAPAIPSWSLTTGTRMKRQTLLIILSAQFLLLGLELGMSYDPLGRQLALAVTNIVTTGGLFWLDQRLRRQGGGLSAVTWVLALTAVWVDGLSNFQHLYGQFWWWDRFTHTLGGMAVTGLFIDWSIERGRLSKPPVPAAAAILLGFLLGQFLGSMYEVSEWLGDWWFATERVRGPFDAPRDLFFNLVGGVVVLAFFRLRRRTA